MPSSNRRAVSVGALITVLIGAVDAAYSRDSLPIVDIQFDSAYQQIDSSRGDKWLPTWSRNGDSFVVSGDGSGFGNEQNNVVLGRLQGEVPNQMKGVVANDMREYADMMEPGEGGASWRATGLYSVDGILYMFVTCRIQAAHLCGLKRAAADPMINRVALLNSSLISSSDQGKTWKRSAEMNLRAPMFRGQRFGAPAFISYGEEGRAAVDNADKYVYAISNDGYFSNGESFILGRVARDRLAALNSSDWFFYRGGNGADVGSWTTSLDRAVPVLTNPGRSSLVGVTYVEGLQRYLMVNWFYSNPGQDFSTTLEFFESPTPWGAWTRFKSLNTGMLGWYVPVVGQKFQTVVDAHTVKAILYTTGNPLNRELLKLNVIPITISTVALEHDEPTYVGGR